MLSKTADSAAYKKGCILLAVKAINKK